MKPSHRTRVRNEGHCFPSAVLGVRTGRPSGVCQICSKSLPQELSRTSSSLSGHVAPQLHENSCRGWASSVCPISGGRKRSQQRPSGVGVVEFRRQSLGYSCPCLCWLPMDSGGLPGGIGVVMIIISPALGLSGSTVDSAL